MLTPRSPSAPPDDPSQSSPPRRTGLGSLVLGAILSALLNLLLLVGLDRLPAAPALPPFAVAVELTPEPPKAEEPKVEPPEPEPPKPEPPPPPPPPEPEPPKPEPPKPEPPKEELPKPLDLELKLPKLEPLNPEPQKAEPQKAEPQKAEPQKAEPQKAEPPKAEPPKAEPPKPPAAPPKPPAAKPPPPKAAGHSGPPPPLNLGMSTPPAEDGPGGLPMPRLDPLHRTLRDLLLGQVAEIWTPPEAFRGRGLVFSLSVNLLPNGMLRPPFAGDQPLAPAQAIFGWGESVPTNAPVGAMLLSLLRAIHLAQPFHLPADIAAKAPLDVRLDFRLDDMP